MRIHSLILAAAAAMLSFPAFADDGPHIENAYARVGGTGSGAVFFEIVNHSDQPDRLIAAASDVAARVELHTHKEDANGVMQMLEVKEGFPIDGKGSRALSRGGDHVMLLGLTKPLAQGDIVTLTLSFERGEVVTVEVPVDNDRKPDHGAMGRRDHSGHGMKAPTN
ncbi:MAG: copper chaperone PCu(A)C [Gemmobacter sp.]